MMRLNVQKFPGMAVIMAAVMVSCMLPVTAQTVPGGTVTAGAAQNVTVLVSNSPLGQILTDSRGMTLYYSAGDMPKTGTSDCYGACTGLWIPFPGGNITVSSPLDPSQFSSFSRIDGIQQATYHGRPLYTYAGDTRPGTTKGNGIRNSWYTAFYNGTVPGGYVPATGPAMVPTPQPPDQGN